MRDPDLGPLWLPKERRSEAEWRAQERRVAAAMKARRHWPVGSVRKCPRCGERAFEGRDDLVHAMSRGERVLVFGHLHGGRCRRCSAQTLEAYEVVRIEDESGVGVRADYEAKVSRIGSGTLGTYWPRDVTRILDLRPDKRAFIEIVGPNAVLVRFREPG